MSGWIKLEKDLRDDVRVRRMALALIESGGIVFNCVPQGTTSAGNAPELQAVTLVVGGLALLWMYADSFAKDDDTVSLSVKEIDQITGVEGFAQIMPEEWLQIIDATHVKLPGFHEHNGVEARQKALTAKRVAKHRDKEKRSTVSAGNGSALPPRPDQTRPRPDPEKKAGVQQVEELMPHASLPIATFNEWLTHRRRMRWPNDHLTIKKQLAILAPFDTETQRKMIDTAIQAGWQGIFEPKGGKPPEKPSGQRWRPGMPED